MYSIYDKYMIYAVHEIGSRSSATKAIASGKITLEVTVQIRINNGVYLNRSCTENWLRKKVLQDANVIIKPIVSTSAYI